MSGKPGSKMIASLTIFFAVMTLISNGLILASFIKRPSLRTPFNCYVINLAIIDLLSALVPMPMNIIKEIYGQWPLNGLICTIVLFINQSCNSGNRAAHLLIATNRLWAVTFPLSYRNRHTKRLAVGIVLFAWTLTMCLVTPRTIISRRKVNYSLSAKDPRCEFDSGSYQAFQMAYNVFAFNAPEVAILIAYPWLVLKLRQTIRNKVTVLPAKSQNSEISENLSSKPQFRWTIFKKVVGPEVVPIAEERGVAANTKDESPKTVNFGRQSYTGMSSQMDLGGFKDAQSRRQMTSSRSRGHNTLFTYLVMSVICCWTPNHVFFLWASITGLWSAPVFTVQYFLAFANSWLNPILVYLADAQIRRAVNELVKCG